MYSSLRPLFVCAVAVSVTLAGSLKIAPPVGLVTLTVAFCQTTSVES